MRKTIAKMTSALIMASVVGGFLFQPVTAQNLMPGRNSGSTSTSAQTTVGGFATSQKCSYSSMQKAVREYQQTNKDVKGWLIVPGTNINEPVVYTSSGNDYYVYRDWKGTYYPNITYKNFVHTAAYIDYRATTGQNWGSTSRNTTIYGHNWTNLRPPFAVGSNNNHIMFGQLPSYTDINFATANPYIYYSTGEMEGVWKVFAVAYSELSTNFIYNAPNPSNEDFTKIVQEWKARSVLNFDVDVSTSDRILTLSTCTRMYNQGSNQRFVVVARLLRSNETDNDPVTVTVNNNVKQPQF